MKNLLGVDVDTVLGASKMAKRSAVYEEADEGGRLLVRVKLG